MISIRNLNQNDMDGFVDMMKKVYEYAGEKNVTSETLLTLFRQAADPDSNLTYIGAFCDQKVVGICSLTFAESSYRIAPFAWLDDMHVEENFRNRGIGLLLLEEAKRFSIAKRCSNILIGVGEIDNRAQKFYLKSGLKDMRCKLFTLPLG